MIKHHFNNEQTLNRLIFFKEFFIREIMEHTALLMLGMTPDGSLKVCATVM